MRPRGIYSKPSMLLFSGVKMANNAITYFFYSGDFLVLSTVLQSILRLKQTNSIVLNIKSNCQVGDNIKIYWIKKGFQVRY